MNEELRDLQKKGLYDASFEHDNCGIGAIIQMNGKACHNLVADALSIVENLEHRAGKDAEGKTGDGVGILTQIPHKFFKKVMAEKDVTLGDERSYGVGMFFFSQDDLERRQSKRTFETIVKKNGLALLGWRQVSISPNVLGSKVSEIEA